MNLTAGFLKKVNKIDTALTQLRKRKAGPRLTESEISKEILQ